MRNQEELERWSAIRQLFGSFTWKDFSDSFRDEVCSKYRIPRFNLPALVFINKRQEYLLYNVNSYQDIQSLLTSLGIISDYMRDRDDLAFYHKEGEELDKYRLECRKACFNQLEEFGLDSQAVQVVINGVEDNNMQAWLRKLLEACKKRRVDSHAQERGVLKCFIAGAKCLERERDAIVAGVNDYNLANNHSKSRVECHSFKNFDSSISKDGQQHLYNEFIREDADLCVFVLDENVGGITKEEFDLAVDTFISSGYKRPTILVFANEKRRAQNEDFEEILQRMKDLKQYWVDYSDLENLKLRLHLELHKLYNQ